MRPPQPPHFKPSNPPVHKTGGFFYFGDDHVRKKEKAHPRQVRPQEMKGPTIMIGLLGKPMSKSKPEGGLLESEMEMPEALSDPGVNKANKANAVLKAQYGPAEGKQMCGNCEYFNTDYDLPKGQGFCEVYEFSCSDKNVCLAWEFDKEEEESEEEED